MIDSILHSFMDTMHYLMRCDFYTANFFFFFFFKKLDILALPLQHLSEEQMCLKPKTVIILMIVESERSG